MQVINNNNSSNSHNSNSNKALQRIYSQSTSPSSNRQYSSRISKPPQQGGEHNNLNSKALIPSDNSSSSSKADRCLGSLDLASNNNSHSRICSSLNNSNSNSHSNPCGDNRIHSKLSRRSATRRISSEPLPSLTSTSTISQSATSSRYANDHEYTVSQD